MTVCAVRYCIILITADGRKRIKDIDRIKSKLHHFFCCGPIKKLSIFSLLQMYPMINSESQIEVMCNFFYSTSKDLYANNSCSHRSEFPTEYYIAAEPLCSLVQYSNHVCLSIPGLKKTPLNCSH
jgi:hypothetical protein